MIPGVDLEKIWETIYEEAETCWENFKLMDSDEKREVIIKTMGIACICGIIAMLTVGFSFIFFLVGGCVAFHRMTRHYTPPPVPEPGFFKKAFSRFAGFFGSKKV